MQTQYSALGYGIDLHFYDEKFAIETDENGHNDKNIHYEIKGQKRIEQELRCDFIRIGLEKKKIRYF